MRTIQEINEEMKRLQDEKSTLYKKESELYRELRDAEKQELVELNGYVKFGDGLAYVESQWQRDGMMTIEGMFIETVDEIKRSSGEKVRYNSGSARLSVSFDEKKMTLDEFRERTTGEEKDIYNITFEEFEAESKKIREDFECKMSIWSWLLTSYTIYN